jgi:hypothetical protein
MTVPYHSHQKTQKTLQSSLLSTQKNIQKIHRLLAIEKLKMRELFLDKNDITNNSCPRVCSESRLSALDLFYLLLKKFIGFELS